MKMENNQEDEEYKIQENYVDYKNVRQEKSLKVFLQF